MVAPSVQVRLLGPILNGKAPAIINAALRGAVGDVAAEGERIIKLQARPRPAGVFHSGQYAAAHGYTQTGNYWRNIRGETTGVGAGVALAAAGVSAGQFFASPHGIIHDSKVIYGPWLEGISSRNQTSRFKGYSLFRKAHQQLETKKGEFLQRRVMEAFVRLR